MRPTLTSKSDRSGNDLSQRVGAGADGLKGLTRKSLREKTCALVAQLDRASDFESEGREFESLRARHFGIRYRDQMPPICRSGRQAVSAEPGSHHLGDTRRRARVECTVTVIPRNSIEDRLSFQSVRRIEGIRSWARSSTRNSHGSA